MDPWGNTKISLFLNGTLNSVTLQLTANGTSAQKSSVSHYDTFIWLLPIFIVFSGIVVASIMGLRFRRINILAKISKLVFVLSVAIFYVQMFLFYYYYIYSILIIVVTSIILLISLLIFLIMSDIWDSAPTSLKPMLSIYEDVVK